MKKALPSVSRVERTTDTLNHQGAGFVWKHPHLPPRHDTAGRRPWVLPLLQQTGRARVTQARVARVVDRDQEGSAPWSCAHKLEERHFIGILLPLLVTKPTRQRTLPKFLALLGVCEQAAVFNFSPGDLQTSLYVSMWPGFGKEQGREWCPPVEPGRAKISFAESDEKSLKKDGTSLHL